MRVTISQYFAASALPACIAESVTSKCFASPDEVVRAAYDYGQRLAAIYEQARTGTNTQKLKSAVE